MTVHIIGAGLSGLACAVSLANKKKSVILYESSKRAGGRCRSFYDNRLKRHIDNGNHLILSGNREAMKYLKTIGSTKSLLVSKKGFPFFDLESKERWVVEINYKLRIPNSCAVDLFDALKLCFANKNATISEIFGTKKPIYRNFWEPMCVSILNTAPEEASAALFLNVLKKTIGHGFEACHPCIARNGLSQSFIDPAINYLKKNLISINFNSRLDSINFSKERAHYLIFNNNEVKLNPDDAVVLAVPPLIAKKFLSEITHPNQFRGIVNAHFTLPYKIEKKNFVGLVGGVSQWIFIRENVASVTVSNANRLAEKSSEEIARILWPEILSALEIENIPLQSFRIIKEKQATFAQTPQQNDLRPENQTRWSNVFLAGDWTQTGLPATIEGAITSGHKVANFIF